MPEFSATFDLSTLTGKNGFRLDGIDASDYSSVSVSSAGDVNGDGFDDILIGAFQGDPGGDSSAGESYLVFGRGKGFPAAFDLSTLNGKNGFRLDGINAFDLSGRSVSEAGDINGDGFGDIVIGALGGDPAGESSAGESYVLFGKAGGFSPTFELSTLNGTNGFRLNGIAADDQSGVSVSSAGDVNGDGFGDILIGAYGGDPGGDSAAGESYVVFGQAGGFSTSLDLSALDGSNGFRLDGLDAGDRSGRSVSAAGDINGDGFGDILIGAPNGDPGGDSSAGETYVVFGRERAFSATFDLTRLNGNNGFRIDGINAGDRSGLSVSSAGDVNADGFDDIVIGGPNGDSSAGESYVVLGKAGGFTAAVDLSALNGKNGFRLDGIDADDQSGVSVSSAGDVNGDGFDDILIGAYGGDPGNSLSAGESYVVFGKARGFSPDFDLSTLDGSNGFRLDGIDAADLSGRSVSAAGDVNGDGFDDILIGASRGNPGGAAYAGESYVVFGHRAFVAVNRAGTALDNIINGGRGEDRISGRRGDDTLIGWQKADDMFGGAGQDLLKAGSGNDTLTGGRGGDRLIGGRGGDVFDFNGIKESGVTGTARDVISGFTFDAAPDATFIDRIDLSTIDANGAGPGDLPFTFIGPQAFDGEGQIRATQSGANTIIRVNTSGSGGTEMTIVLQNFTATDLTAADFIL